MFAVLIHFPDQHQAFDFQPLRSLVLGSFFTFTDSGSSLGHEC